MTKTYLKFRSRITILSCFIIIFWVGLSVRLFQIQVLNGNYYRTQGIRQGQIQIPLQAVRGNIYDRNDTPLTRNIIHYTIAVHPEDVLDKQGIAEALNESTSRPVDYYLKKINSRKSFVYLERNLRRDDCTPILNIKDPGLILERYARRHYPQINIASQLIGFNDVDDNGLTGVEKRFDKYLRGKPGWVIKQRDGRGIVNPKNNFPSQQPVDGANIQLTIDLSYQSVLQEELVRRMVETNSVRATGILMDPQTGAILAMASVPDFDPNNPGQYPTENQKIRSITDQFEPGSTFKIVAATAAIDQNIVSLDREFNCEFGGFQYKDIRINDHEEYGLLTISQIIENSSNVGIIKIADLVGRQKLYQYGRNYGFGSLTQINLLGEIPGIFRKTNEWSDISLAEISMGHEVGVTALQLAMAYCTIANDGFLIKPRLVNQIIDAEGNIVYAEKPEVFRKVASVQVMSELKKMLVKVVESGTGTKARIPGWSVAGKTGTAQKFIDGSYSSTKFISNFVGFLPAEDPQLLSVIILDEPKYGYHWGGIGAALVFKRIVQRIINMDDSIHPPQLQKDNLPEPVLAADTPSGAKVKTAPILLRTASVFQKINNDDSTILPEVRGMSLRKAVSALTKAGIKARLNGSGTVFWQSPPPGTKVTVGSICQIGLK